MKMILALLGSGCLRALCKVLCAGSHSPACRAGRGLPGSSCTAPCAVELLPQIPLVTAGLCARLALPAHCLCSGRAGFTFSVSTVQIDFQISKQKWLKVGLYRSNN